MRYTIKNDDLKVEADTLGAELVSVKLSGREQLWQNENGAWAGHAPVLFPVCGNCGMRLGGADYAMPRHGFARRMQFALDGQGENFLRFFLRESGETLQIFPFPFALYVTYTIAGSALTTRYEVVCRGAELPFSCGMHTSYRLFGNVFDHMLVFPQAEEFSALVHDGAGRLTGERVNYGGGKVFPLPEQGLAEGRTVIFGDLRSRSVTLCSAKRGVRAEIGFAGFPHLLLWRPEGANMICIEPWLTLPDRAGEHAEFREKAGVVCLKRGERASFEQKIIYQSGDAE